jgi:disulfide bond formation protein DsbB
VIASRAQRRALNALGVLIVAGLMGYALYTEYGPLHLEPCPLCIFQRIGMIALGLVFLAAALHAPRGLGARVYGVLGAVVAVAGGSVSAWHVHVQHLPPDKVPSCGPGLAYMWDTFPLADVLNMVFNGSGECHEVNWSFLGLAMPTWVLIWFVALGALAVAANWARVAR